MQREFEDYLKCGRLGHRVLRVKIIASIEDPVVIRKILEHLKKKGGCQEAVRLPESRGPPQTSLFE